MLSLLVDVTPIFKLVTLLSMFPFQIMAKNVKEQKISAKHLMGSRLMTFPHLPPWSPCTTKEHHHRSVHWHSSPTWHHCCTFPSVGLSQPTLTYLTSHWVNHCWNSPVEMQNFVRASGVIIIKSMSDQSAAWIYSSVLKCAKRTITKDAGLQASARF